jgi:hypothetical protein
MARSHSRFQRESWFPDPERRRYSRRRSKEHPMAEATIELGASQELIDFMRAGEVAPEETPVRAPWLRFSREDKVTAIDDAQQRLDELKATYITPLQKAIEAMKAAVIDELQADDATVVAHPYLEVKLEVKKERQVRIDVLRRLYDLAAAGKVDLAAVKKFVYEHQPDPEWKTDFRYARQLLQYGGEVATVMAAGVVETNGEPKLVIKPKPRPMIPATPADLSVAS